MYVKTSAVTMIIEDSGPDIFGSNEVKRIISKLKFSPLYLTINKDFSY